MKQAHVITIRDGMVERVHTFNEQNGFISTKAIEHEFLKEVSSNVPNWGEYTDEDCDAICSNGFEDIGADSSVQIFWSDQYE